MCFESVSQDKQVPEWPSSPCYMAVMFAGSCIGTVALINAGVDHGERLRHDDGAHRLDPPMVLKDEIGSGGSGGGTPTEFGPSYAKIR